MASWRWRGHDHRQEDAMENHSNTLPSPSRMTNSDWYIAICWQEQTPSIPPLEDFRRWLNATGEKDVEMMAKLALHRAIRDRGGLRPDERLPVWVLLVRPGGMYLTATKVETCIAYHYVIRA
jgi:hypothetical protein